MPSITNMLRQYATITQWQGSWDGAPEELRRIAVYLIVGTYLMRRA